MSLNLPASESDSFRFQTHFWIVFWNVICSSFFEGFMFSSYRRETIVVRRRRPSLRRRCRPSSSVAVVVRRRRRRCLSVSSSMVPASLRCRAYRAVAWVFVYGAGVLAMPRLSRRRVVAAVVVLRCRHIVVVVVRRRRPSSVSSSSVARRPPSPSTFLVGASVSLRCRIWL